MPRTKNGYILLYSSLLDKDFSPVTFKIWVGLLLIANHRGAKEPGLVDLSLRDIADKLNVSIGALDKAKDQFIKEKRIELVRLPAKTKPILGIRILNYQLYQNGKKVISSEQSEKVLSNEQSLLDCSFSETKIVLPSEQKVLPSEQSVSPSEQSRAYATPTKENKINKRKEDNKISILNKEKIPHNGKANEIWLKALEGLKNRVNKANYQTWLEGTVGLSFHDSEFIIGVKNHITAEYLSSNQRSLIENMLCGITNQDVHAQFQSIEIGSKEVEDNDTLRH